MENKDDIINTCNIECKTDLGKKGKKFCASICNTESNIQHHIKRHIEYGSNVTIFINIYRFIEHTRKRDDSETYHKVKHLYEAVSELFDDFLCRGEKIQHQHN